MVGLALSNAPQCHVALTGCLLCVFVVLVAVISLACHNIEKKAVEKRAEAGPLIVKPPKEEKNDTKPRVSARSEMPRSYFVTAYTLGAYCCTQHEVDFNF